MDPTAAASEQQGGDRSGSTGSSRTRVRIDTRKDGTPVRRGRRTKLTYDKNLYCEPDPDDYENLVSPKTLVNTPRYARGRIKDVLVQVRGLIAVRLDKAERPFDVATEQGMADEIGAMVMAIKHGTPSDVRCARIALAATLILLAERDDRPPPPAEGSRAQAASRPPLDLSVDE
jgi:hypothetical protein